MKLCAGVGLPLRHGPSVRDSHGGGHCGAPSCDVNVRFATPSRSSCFDGFSVCRACAVSERLLRCPRETTSKLFGATRAPQIYVFDTDHHDVWTHAQIQLEEGTFVPSHQCNSKRFSKSARLVFMGNVARAVPFWNPLSSDPRYHGGQNDCQPGFVISTSIPAKITGTLQKTPEFRKKIRNDFPV